jgi:glycosyltransferase involved in cell wall biosynthesis
MGAGLKIKNVEALASGLPLVTTGEGARGIADVAGDAFLVADDPDAFASACLRLLDDVSLRTRVAARALQVARERFSPQACFAPLLDWIGGL